MSDTAEVHFHVTGWPALMTREQASSYLSIGSAQLRLLIANGSIKPVMLPDNARDLKFRRYDLDKFIDSLDKAMSNEAIRKRHEMTQAAVAGRKAKRKQGVE